MIELDPYPRTPDEWDDLWDPIDRVWVPRRSLSAPLVLGLIAGAFLAGFIVHAALAANHVAAAILPATSEAPPTSATADGGSSAASLVPGAPSVLAHASASLAAPATPKAAERTAAPTPRPKPPKVTAGTVRGTASWYCGHGSRCTVGHPGGYFAAIRSDLLGHRGDQARVCSASRCVVVTIIDCLCASGPGIVDLYADAFDDLAPLSRGRIQVTVQWL